MTDETTPQGQAETIGGGDGPSPEEATAWQEFEKEESIDATAPDHGAAGDNDDSAISNDEPEEDRALRDGAAEAKPSSDPAPGDVQSSPGAEQQSVSDAAVWESATPEQRSAYEKLLAEKTDLASRRQGQDRKIRELNETLIRVGSPAAPSKDGATGTKLDLGEDWSEFQGDYPEAAGRVEELMKTQQSMIDSLSRQLSAVGQSAINSVIADNEARLTERFPDWQQTVASQQFRDWIKTQPRMVRDGIMRNGKAIVDYNDAADVMQRFNGGTVQTQAGNPNPAPETDPAPATDPSRKRDRQLEASQGSGPTRGPAMPVGVPEDGDPAILWKQLEKAGL